MNLSRLDIGVVANPKLVRLAVLKPAEYRQARPCPSGILQAQEDADRIPNRRAMRKEQTGSKSRCLNRACHAHDSCVGRCACGGTQIQITNAPKSTHLLGENREKKELLPLHFVSRRKNREREERCLCASLPCPVLQYADDTLILVRGSVGMLLPCAP